MTDENKYAVLRAHLRYPLERQIREAAELDCARNYIFGQDGVDDWRDIANQVDDGDTVCIAMVMLFAPSKATPRARRDAVVDAIDTIRDNGGEVYEWRTGRTTADPDQRRATVKDALQAITTGKMTAIMDERGRPKLAFTQAEFDAIQRHYHSPKHATNAAAVEAVNTELKKQGVKRRISYDQARKAVIMLGLDPKSGRPFAKRKRK